MAISRIFQSPITNLLSPMSEFLNLILAIVIIIFAAKTAGALSVRIGQPSVLGELLAGLILGPTVLNMLEVWPMFAADQLLPETLTLLAEFGVLLLMMLAGLELHLNELLATGKVAGLAGSLGVLLPVVMGYGTAVLFGLPFTEAVFIGLALSATSVSISAQTLMELDVLRSRVGLSMLGAAVFDDVLVILLLSLASLLLVSGGRNGDIGSLLLTIGRMAGYLVGASLVGIWLLPRLVNKVSDVNIHYGMLTFALATALLYAWTAEAVGGMSGITGAFMAGLFFARTPYRRDIEQGIAAMGYGLFVPIFFVNIGLSVNLAAINGGAWIFAIVLTLVAVVSKILGAGAGARLGGLTNRESFQLGVGMVSRGEVGLIVAAFALTQGILTQDSFSITVSMVIIATLVTPPMLRLAFAKEKEAVAGG